jgi:hypothetical protein
MRTISWAMFTQQQQLNEENQFVVEINRSELLFDVKAGLAVGGCHGLAAEPCRVPLCSDECFQKCF